MAVRRESVVLDLSTNFPPEAAKAAAAISLLNDRVKGLNKGAVESSRANQQLAKSVNDVEKSTAQGGKEIDRYSGRLRLIADAVAVLGPGLVPIGAVAIPAVSGLAAQMGFAAVAGGTLIAAFQGVGDALKAVNEAALDPSVKNLDKAREAMARISPEAQGFVRQIRDMMPALKGLRDTAAAGLFPGFVEGLQQIETALPKVERIIAAVAGELGDIAADSGASLAGPRWAEFFDFLATDSAPALRQMADGVGNIAHAMAELWMAFDPLNDDFGSWLVDVTGKLDSWASGLSQTQGFAEFIDYVRTTGPQVAETFGAIVNMMVQISKAAAPLGGPVLAGLEAVANVIASIADSDLGTPIFTALAALALYNRALQATAALSRSAFMGGGGSATAVAATSRRRQASALVADARTARSVGNSAQARAQAPAGAVIAQAAAADRLKGSLRGMGAEAGKAGALVGGLALASTDLGSSLGVTNTASLALMGTMAGPWGAAAGAAVGTFLDLRAANEDLAGAIKQVDQAMKSGDFAAMAAGADALSEKLGQAKDRLTNIPMTGGLLALIPNITGAYQKLTGATDEADAKLRKVNATLMATGALGGAEEILRASGLMAEGMGLTTDSARKSAAALAAARTAAGETGRAFTGLGKDVNNAKVDLGGWLSQLEAQNRSLNNFADNAIRAGRRGLRDGLIKELQAAGPEGALRMEQLANGSQAALNRANMSWVRSRQAIDKYQDAVEQATTGVVGKVNVFSRAINNLPKRVQTEIKQNGLERSRAAIVDLTRRYNLNPKQIRTLIREQGGRPTKAMVDRIIESAQKLDRTNPTSRISAKDGATPTINGVIQRLNSIPRTVTTHVYTRRHEVGNAAGTSANPTHNADGGSVPKTGLGYADRHHYLLADGEEVISNRFGQADRHRDLLKAINANRLADGGTATDAVKASIASANRGGAYYGSSGSSRPVSLSGLTIRGTLSTEFGMADIEGMIVDAIDDDREMTSMVERTAPAYG